MNKSENNEKIAIIGSRGIPNNYGGFEKFAEVISVKLSKKGYKVFVSCENPENRKNKDRTIKNYGRDGKNEDSINSKSWDSEYQGVSLFYFPLKRPKSGSFRMVYEILYDIYSLYWASRKCDYVYMLGYSAAFFLFIPKLFAKKLWINPDGIEWKRSKFNPVIKLLLKLCERLAVFWADEVIADSKEVKRYLDNRYGINACFIPYGAKQLSEINLISWDSQRLPERIRGVTPNPSYWLMVARLEPENNVHTIITAYLNSNVEKPLVVVGNFSSPTYEAAIMDLVRKKPEKQVIFAGGIYDQESLNMLRQNCFAYIHGHSVGGTNPSLLEIMALKTVILAHGNPYNREVCGDSAIYFEDAPELSEKLGMIDANMRCFSELKERAYKRVRENYSWDTVADDYESIIRKME